MAKEKALWQRLLRVKNEHGLDLNRLENTAGEGTPDVEGWIGSWPRGCKHSAACGFPICGCFPAGPPRNGRGAQIWMELKSCKRPARPTTVIRYNTSRKTAEMQERWQKNRAAAGCRTGWILVQVGEGHKARLYLIPGPAYGQLVDTENALELLSVCDPHASPHEVLLRAALGW